MQTLKLMNIQLSRSKKIRHAKLLWQFSWEKQEGVKYQSENEMKNVLKMIARDTKGLPTTGRRGIGARR